MITLTTEQAQQIEEASARVEQSAEECMGDDGMVMVVPLDLYNELVESLEAIRAARAQEQAEQTPVAWKDLTYGNLHHQDFGNSIPLYTNPVCTKDLTVDEKVALADRLNLNGRIVVIDAVIAAYKEKNKYKLADILLSVDNERENDGAAN